MTSGRNPKTLFNSELFGFPPDFVFGSRKESGDLAKGTSPSNRIAHKEESCGHKGRSKSITTSLIREANPALPHEIEFVPGLFLNNS
jgi:hypothetical protein